MQQPNIEQLSLVSQIWWNFQGGPHLQLIDLREALIETNDFEMLVSGTGEETSRSKLLALVLPEPEVQFTVREMFLMDEVTSDTPFQRSFTAKAPTQQGFRVLDVFWAVQRFIDDLGKVAENRYWEGLERTGKNEFGVPNYNVCVGS